jgi:prephenate dehydrogenase
MPSAPQLTIIGLGLIGGSLGMAVRQAKLGYQVVGHDLRHEAAGRAKKLGAVDRAEWNLPAAVEAADVVVVATPVRAVESTFRDIAPHLKPGCVVTDTASTKARVLAWAAALLPTGVSFVGGHPMAGKEASGVDAAEAALFAGSVYCISPGERADQHAIDRVVDLATGVGARPFFVDPGEHDSYVAAVSHLPFLLSAALVNVTSQSPAWRDLAKVASTGFRDVTRLASGDPVMHRDICLTNQESILRWLDAFGAELADLARRIREGEDELEKSFESAKVARDSWLAARQALDVRRTR